MMANRKKINSLKSEIGGGGQGVGEKVEIRGRKRALTRIKQGDFQN